MAKNEKKKRRAKLWTITKRLFWLAVVTTGIVLFLKSPLSRITEISVKGMKYATQSEILGATSFKKGDLFFWKNPKEISQHIERTVSTVSKAKVTKQFPGKIYIEIVEFPLVAYEFKQEKLYLLLANGTLIKSRAENYPLNRPVFASWERYEKLKKALCQKLAKVSPEILSDLSEIRPDPTVSYPDRIRIYTSSHFEVITSIRLFQEKIMYVSGVTETQSPGIITMLAADSYMPYPTQ